MSAWRKVGALGPGPRLSRALPPRDLWETLFGPRNSYTFFKIQTTYDSLLKTEENLLSQRGSLSHTHTGSGIVQQHACLPRLGAGFGSRMGMQPRGARFMTVRMGACLHTGGGGAAYMGRVVQTLQTPTREFSRASYGLGLSGYSWSNPFSSKDEETEV